MEGNSNLKWNEHSANLLSKLHNMLERKAFVDITLATDEGLSIQVHRVILCAVSTYFQHQEDKHITIILTDISFEHLTPLIEFMYKGKVQVPCCQLPGLLEAASALKIKGLADTIKDDQQQHDQPVTHQPEIEETLLKIVSVQSIAQRTSQSDEPMSWEDNDVVVKEEDHYDSDDTVVYEPEENDWISGDGAPNPVNQSELKLFIFYPKASSTDSTGRKSDRSSNKRKKIHLQHSSPKASSPTLTTTSKRTSSVEDEEGSSRKRSPSKRQEKECQHQVALDFTKDFAVLGDGIPPVPIIFKQEKEQEEKNQNDMLCNQRTETDSDDKDATIYYSSLEDVSTDSSDDDGDYEIATSSTAKPKTKATKSMEKPTKCIKERKQKVPSLPRTVSKGSFKCDECGRIYKHRKSLNAHLKYECGKEASFCCTICKYRTAIKSGLKRHLIGVHNMKDAQLAAHGFEHLRLGPTVRPEMPFKCDKCPRTYKYKGGLKRHMNNECGVDPRFQCSQCDHRTKQKEHLREHLTATHGVSSSDFVKHGVGYVRFQM